jgi:hypothetical protein
MKKITKHRRRPEGRRNIDCLDRDTLKRANHVRSRPVSVRSVSGLSYPVRGKLGLSLAEERS